MKRRKTVLLPVLLLATLLVALAIIIYVSVRSHVSGLLNDSYLTSYTGGWKTADGEPVTLPGQLPQNGHDAVTIFNALPSDMPGDAYLYLETNFQQLEVIADGHVLFSLSDRDVFNHIAVTSTYLIKIPASEAGQNIEIKLTPYHPDREVVVYRLTLGDGITTAINILESKADIAFLFFILSILTGINIFFLILLGKQKNRSHFWSMLSLTAFIFISATWILTDSKILYLFLNHAEINVYLYSFSFMLMPVPLLLYFRQLFIKGKAFVNLLVLLYLAVFCFRIICHILAIADLMQTLFLVHILMSITALLFIVLGIKELVKRRHNKSFLIQAAITVLGFAGLFSIFRYVTTSNDSSVLVEYGLVVLSAAIGFSAVRDGMATFVKTKNFEKLTGTIPSGICRIENLETAHILYANPYYYDQFGYSASEANKIGFTSADFTVLPTDLPKLKASVREYRAAKLSSFELEARHVTKKGAVLWILSRFRLDADESGEMTVVMVDITDRKTAEERLRISEEEYRIATKQSNKMILRYDFATDVCCRQPDAAHFVGFPDVIENASKTIAATPIVAKDSKIVFTTFIQAVLSGERNGSAVVSLLDREESRYKWYHLDFTTIFDEMNEPARSIISLYDVTPQYQKELAFRRWQQNYEAILNTSAYYYDYNLTSDKIEHEEGRLFPTVPKTVSRTLSGIAQHVAEREVFECDREHWLSFMSRERLLERYAAGLNTDKTEFRRFSNGAAKWTSLSVQLIPDPYSTAVKGYFLLEDIDEKKNAELTLQERSIRDALTGLLNRGAFIEQIDAILAKSDERTQHALIMLDIDNFKSINDTLGHSAGDALLMNIAEKLRFALRSDDVCGRLGGDEFVILLKNMNFGKPLEARVNDLCNLICDELVWGIAVSASFGIAGYPNDGLTFEELYKKADVALYKAKAHGRGGYALYDPQLSFDDLSLKN
ncbi:diguanylate cyclase [Oscillospiraceae bacterium CM]|nr:diguanylate cyclase [Oscillospiraceae bacterium CM]